MLKLGKEPFFFVDMHRICFATVRMLLQPRGTKNTAEQETQNVLSKDSFILSKDLYCDRSTSVKGKSNFLKLLVPGFLSAGKTKLQSKILQNSLHSFADWLDFWIGFQKA